MNYNKVKLVSFVNSKLLNRVPIVNGPELSQEVEKITLKPAVKEFLYKSSEPGVCFDILSYGGVNTQEKNLGSLYVLGQLKQKEAETDYLVSLVSSLAKREYYSQPSLIEQDPKASFERTLKKLNEVLDDFFKNKDFTLNLGLAIIAGDNIYISRLGKFKVALARNGEYIDILNNIQLFKKEDGDERQFANIISGKLKAGDKIFAYFPNRSITSREKLLNPLFISQDQDQFSQKIAALAANANSFSCCGIHLDVKEIKEIPVEAVQTDYFSQNRNSKSSPDAGSSRINPDINPEKTGPTGQESESDDESESDFEAQTDVEPKPAAATSAIRAEVSMTKRGNFAANAVSKITQIFQWNHPSRPRLTDIGEPKPIKIGSTSRSGSYRIFLIAAAAVILPILGWSLTKNGGSSPAKDALKQASESLNLARSQLAQNSPKEARNLLQKALAQIGNLESKEIRIIRNDIDKTLGAIDHVSEKQPELVYNSNGKDWRFTKASFYADGSVILDHDGNLFHLTSGEPVEIGQFKAAGKFIFTGEGFIASFNGIANFEIYRAGTKKITASTLKNDVEFQDAAIYEGNLYGLASGKIEKYSDITAGGVKSNLWGDVSNSGTSIALAVDGNIYVLNIEGKVSKYFRAKKEAELDFQIKPSSSAKISTDKNSPFIYLADKDMKRVFVFDKETGELKISYKLDVAGEIQDISVKADGSVLILSKTNNLWQIKP